MHSRPDASSTAALRPLNFRGAFVMILGPVSEEALEFAGGLQCRYGKLDGAEEPQVEVMQADRTWSMKINPSSAAQEVLSLAAV
jgi:hypothetical protein